MKVTFKAWDKRLQEYRHDVVITQTGNIMIARHGEAFNKMVNKWHKKNGEILGGDYAELDYTDWYGVENIEIQDLKFE